MLPSRHIMASLPLGLTLGLLSQSMLTGMLCFFSGILIDIDHIIEYMAHFGWKNHNLNDIYRACKKSHDQEQEIPFSKLYFILHLGELAILLWVAFLLTRDIHILSMAVGYTGHIALDMVGNLIRPSAYFMSIRIKNDFQTHSLLKTKGYAHGRIKELGAAQSTSEKDFRTVS